ncbi:MAG: sulfatase [Bryobacterales bacterium]|nr:sulfatase [Bryobacterales bacterium]
MRIRTQLATAAATLLVPILLWAQDRPNFVLIFADDLGYGDLSSFGATRHRTPHLDRMASEGIRLTDFYVSVPFCGPSRATLLTGRYPFRYGMVVNPSPDAGRNDVGLPSSEITIAEAVKPLGYATAAIGKWHLGHVERFLPRKQGFDEYYGILYSNDMRPVQLVQNEEVVQYPVLQAELTKDYTNRAIDFIKRNRERPFFLYLPHAMPHKPLAASADFYTPDTPDDLYSDVIRELDWSVGEILNTLRETGLDERTMVFFTSDNGATFGGYNGGLRSMKGSNFDGGLRVPAIARWPGRIPPGQVSGEVLASIDLFPTIVLAAGATLPGDRAMDGLDILPLLEGRATDSPHEAIFAMGGEKLKMVRSGRWKLHVRSPQPGFRCLDDASEWKDPRGPDGITIIAQFEQADPSQCPGLVSGPEPKPMMLFDMAADRGEQRDVADEHPEVVARLKGIFDRMDADVPEEFEIGSRAPELLWLHGGELRYDREIKPLPLE